VEVQIGTPSCHLYPSQLDTSVQRRARHDRAGGRAAPGTELTRGANQAIIPRQISAQITAVCALLSLIGLAAGDPTTSAVGGLTLLTIYPFLLVVVRERLEDRRNAPLGWAGTRRATRGCAGRRPGQPSDRYFWPLADRALPLFGWSTADTSLCTLMNTAHSLLRIALPRHGATKGTQASCQPASMWSRWGSSPTRRVFFVHSIAFVPSTAGKRAWHQKRCISAARPPWMTRTWAAEVGSDGVQVTRVGPASRGGARKA